jgi:hypothetical protein
VLQGRVSVAGPPPSIPAPLVRQRPIGGMAVQLILRQTAAIESGKDESTVAL